MLLKPSGLEPPQDRRADQAAVAGDEDARVRLHLDHAGRS